MGPTDSAPFPSVPSIPGSRVGFFQLRAGRDELEPELELVLEGMKGEST